MKLPSPPADNKYRVLVVEDDDSISKLIATHFKMAGFDCRLASNGFAGWNAFLECDPHLVLADISMPGISGHELTTKIRAQSGVPVILMTAASTDDNEMMGFKSGADDYVAKPFNPKLLLARVVAHLRRVYRYDEAASPAPKVGLTPRPAPVKPAPVNPVASALPEGWTKCDTCDYMGPEHRFNATDQKGNHIYVCPHCKNRAVTFSVN